MLAAAGRGAKQGCPWLTGSQQQADTCLPGACSHVRTPSTLPGKCRLTLVVSSTHARLGQSQHKALCRKHFPHRGAAPQEHRRPPGLCLTAGKQVQLLLQLEVAEALPAQGALPWQPTPLLLSLEEPGRRAGRRQRQWAGCRHALAACGADKSQGVRSATGLAGEAQP